MNTTTSQIRTKISEEELKEAVRVLKEVHGFKNTAIQKHMRDFVGIIDTDTIIVDTYLKYLGKQLGQNIAYTFLDQDDMKQDLGQHMAEQEDVLFFDMGGSDGMYCWLNSQEIRKAFGR